MQLVSSCFCKRGPVEQATHLLWAGEPALGKKKKASFAKEKESFVLSPSSVGEEPFSSSFLGCGEGKS